MLLVLAGIVNSLFQLSADTIAPFIDEICGFVTRT